MVMLLWISSLALAASEQQTLLQTRVEVALEVDDAVCHPDCESCGADGETCEICHVGFHLSRTAGASCIACNAPTECEHCSIDPLKCDQCRAGWFLDLKVGSCTLPTITDCEFFEEVEGEETCERCLDGHRMETDGSCVKCDDSNPHCRSCDAGVGICDKCSPGFFLDTNDCVACTAENCERCSDELSKCSACGVGYTFDDAGVCVKCHQSGCHECDNNRSVCDQCRPNFIKDEDSGTCCGPCPAGTKVEVCGLNGKTYSNACEAGCANQHIMHPGRCSADCADIKNKVCGDDGKNGLKIYESACDATDAGVTIVPLLDCR